MPSEVILVLWAAVVVLSVWAIVICEKVVRNVTKISGILEEMVEILGETTSKNNKDLF